MQLHSFAGEPLKRFIYRRKIVERDLDSFGHVNNASYLSILEEARWEFITAGGFGLEKIQKMQKGPVILDINLQFKKEILNRQDIEVISFVNGYRNSMVFNVRQEIMRLGEETPATIADFGFGFFDMRLRRLMAHPLDWCLAMGLSEAHHQDLYRN